MDTPHYAPNDFQPPAYWQSPTLFQPTILWTSPLEEVGDDDRPWTKLLGQLTIAGVPHHIEGWAVEYITTKTKWGEQRDQCAVSDETNYEDLLPLTDGAGVTVEINGHDYFMVVTPHQL